MKNKKVGMMDKKISPNATWTDTDGLHKKLSKYAEINGMKINFIYKKLVEKFLKDPEIIK